MGVRKTQEQFEQEVFNIVGIDYSVLGKYTNTDTKISTNKAIIKDG